VAAVRPLLTVLAAVVFLAGCAGSDEEETAAPADGVRELTSLDPLKAVFNADEGTPRLLLILDPT
jgi:nitrous oxide reductase accessory protein NosL